MLRKIVRTKKFWNERVGRFPYCVSHVKIANMRPENYKLCKHISIPTGNRERLWGFNNFEDAQCFVRIYNGKLLGECVNPCAAIAQYVFVLHNEKI